MCGIAGAVFFDKPKDQKLIESIIKKMCDQMHRRGPDNKSFWFDKNNNIGLGHNRLAIIDLSKQANQPMVSKCKRYIVVFNGEIYNYKSLKNDLIMSGDSFNTDSDTEVLLKLYIKEGPNMLLRLRGMFAIAIWDQKEKKMFLARDPYGIKPLYIGVFKGGFLFASQVKALLSCDLINKRKNKKAKTDFFLLGNVQEPETWFADIQSLRSGFYCTYSLKDNKMIMKKYIDINDIWLNADKKIKKKIDVQQVIKDAVKKSISNHLVSDVPIGVLLSGGIDSVSLIAHFKDLNQNIQGITISFKEYKNSPIDEAPRAIKVAKYYNIKHHVRVVTKEEFKKDLPLIISAMDQPSIDGINTWYACKAASELKLKVVLSGVGGDELFFGYPSFSEIPLLINFFHLMKFMPGFQFLLKIIGCIIANITKNNKWKYLFKYGFDLRSAFWLKRGLFNPSEIYQMEGFQKIDIKKIIQKTVKNLSKNKKIAISQMESQIYLRNQLLRDSDWASMYHSIELRTPLVDFFLLKDLKDVIYSFSKFKGKIMLSQSAKTFVPEYITKSVKTGFSIPIGNWIKEMKVYKNTESKYFFSDKNHHKYLAQYIVSNIYKKYK